MPNAGNAFFTSWVRYDSLGHKSTVNHFKEKLIAKRFSFNKQVRNFRPENYDFLTNISLSTILELKQDFGPKWVFPSLKALPGENSASGLRTLP
jgi:hypothetical protein